MAQAPTGATAAPQGGGWTVVRWDAVPGADCYESQHEGESYINRTIQPETALIAIAPGTTRYTKIRNIVDGVSSAWVRVTLSESGTIVSVDGEPVTPTPPKPDPDPTPPPKPPKPPQPPKPDPDPTPPSGAPTAPEHVRAHCITHQSSKVEWDRDPVVHEYEVWLDADRDAAQRTQDTLVTVTGLTAQTRYTAYVVARTRDGATSEPGTVVFDTGSPEPAPDPDPDTDTDADWPAPQLTVWPLENGRVRATWTDPDDGRKPKSEMGYPFWHVSLDGGRTWYFTRDRQYEFEVLPGAEVMASVYGVWDNTLTAIATKGVAL